MDTENNLILKINENEHLEFRSLEVQYSKDKTFEYIELQLWQNGKSRILGSDEASNIDQRFSVALTNNVQDHKTVTYLGETVVHFMTLSGPHTIFFLSLPNTYNNTNIILLDVNNNLLTRFTLTLSLRGEWNKKFLVWRKLIKQ
jgi:hypothetical protein